MRSLSFLSIALCSLHAMASESPITLDFNDACVSKESIETKKGGVLENIDMWVQGKWMRYTHCKDKNCISAEGQLRLEYHGQLFVGERIDYDFHSKTGVIINGRTHCGAFYIAAERIYLSSDGGFIMEGARLTMCESRNPSWQIKAKSLSLADDNLVRAKSVIFKIARMPLLWLPTMRANLDHLSKSPFEYQAVWKSAGGPRLTLKYQIFSWKHSQANLRLDWRLRRGPGVGVESRYEDTAKQMSFISNSYIARDRKITNPKNKARYRVEGAFEHTSKNHSRYARLTYDKLSDPQMPYDYPRDTFELPSAKPTRLATYTHLDDVTLAVISEAKINRFETIKQQLPSFEVTQLPQSLFSGHLLVKTPLEIAFLDYRFASRWKGRLSNFSTLRLFGHPELKFGARPGPFEVKASFEPIYLYYATGQNEKHTSVRLLHTTAEAELPLTKRWGKGAAHTISPFARHEYYSEPARLVAEHDVFDLDDAYAKLNLLDSGIRTSFTRLRPCGIEFFEARGYFQNFWDLDAYSMHFGRLCFDLSWQRPNLFAGAKTAWSRMHRLFEFANGWIRWTVSDNLAINFEMRHRSKYAWRKLDNTRFFLESAHSVDELLASPLSDARNTAISRLALRLSPTWRVFFQSRHCWARANERLLNDFRVDLRHYLSCNLEIGASVTHTEANKIKVGISVSVSRYPLRPKMRVKRFKPSW